MDKKIITILRYFFFFFLLNWPYKIPVCRYLSQIIRVKTLVVQIDLNIGGAVFNNQIWLSLLEIEELAIYEIVTVSVSIISLPLHFEMKKKFLASIMPISFGLYNCQ